MIDEKYRKCIFREYDSANDVFTCTANEYLGDVEEPELCVLSDKNKTQCRTYTREALKTMTRLSKEQIDAKIAFIDQYKGALNAATGSLVDANANVSSKNIATLSAEMNKDINIQINQRLMYTKIKELHGRELAVEFIRQLESHEIYCHDASHLFPYCVSFSIYPFLLDGMTNLDGTSTKPTHLDSFAGAFINLVFGISSQFAGATAAVEMLMCLDHFARLDLGDNYLEQHSTKIANIFQQIVHTINQPAAARGYQSIFFNTSVLDKYYFEGLFGDFMFPTGEKPNWESVEKLQEFFLIWFNKEREHSVLTFPVVTASLLTENGKPKDKQFATMCSEQLAAGNSFFVYSSDSVDSLSSCCRLRNEITEKPQFSYTLGAGGVATGSINVITLNMSRLEQDRHRDLSDEIRKIQLYQVAYRALMDEYKNAGLLTVYDAGYINLDQQFLTIGICGLVEAAESQGLEPTYNEEYVEFLSSRLKVIYDANRKANAEFGYKFNTEAVPAENLGVKFAGWDKKDGYIVPRNCYNSYFFPMERDDIDIVDKFRLHGTEVVQYLDGGSACHVNLQEHLTAEGYYNLICLGAKAGTNYWGTNIASTCCKEQGCNHIDKRTLETCSKCGSPNVTYATRVIGYLKEVASFSKPRQDEHAARHYHN